MKKIDRFIVIRLFLATLMVLGVLIFIFIVIDFSENSDTFSDRGATMKEIWGQYYLNYIPEMTRLVAPLAVFVAILLIAGQMSDRLELTAIKGAGVSIYRFMAPFMLFAIAVTGLLSYLDGFVIPGSNAERFAFEQQYLTRQSDRLDRNRLYRQESEQTILTINYFENRSQTAYSPRLVTYQNGEMVESMEAARMVWQPEISKWRFIRSERRVYSGDRFETFKHPEIDTVLTTLPRDVARTTSDIYQLTYPEIIDYIASLERSGVGGISLQKVQFYGKLFYPFGTIVIALIGIGISTNNRKGGRGVLLGSGLIIIFFYLIIMKLMEPFGASGQIDPLVAATLPHIIFFILSLILLWRTPK